ncbi:hypothetical protein EV200_105134 [Pedobacter psychrotolerans]|uniref:DUF4848 domain-containing protein n=1 Tax=Pedobacter psychrotolerans TaxID=1843235 RepID=A0A4R2HAC0_9SPHI|nr:hypothetical protein [Pedobacter psychrotolerans]TCO23665.1 hypothetical protein EV200_105134 [Pedobacter psychrotolerans]GGE61677.1 hypothetical protein GCM10011413_30030 [Pedobacter psychrotolerans]
MRNNKKLKCIVLLSICVLSIYSCKKDAVVESVNENKSLSNAISIENGYLKFRDQKAFDSLENIIINYSPHQLDAWEKTLVGFSSYRSTYLKAQNEYANVNSSESFNSFKKKYSDLISIRPDSSLTYKFGTPFSAIITNNSGELKIGDQFRKYTNESSLILYTGAHKNLSELKNSTDIKVLPIKKLLMSVRNAQSLAPPQGNSAFGNGMVSQYLFYSGDNKRRLYVELWVENTPPPNLVEFGSCRLYFVVLQELKKTFGGWRSNETDYYSNGVNLKFTSTHNLSIPNSYSFNGSFNAIQGVTGPIIYNMPSFPGYCSSVTGTGRFTTGGVPDAPGFGY